MIDIAASLPIEGWMEPDDLEWLAYQAGRHTRIVEVGAWMGRSTMVLANHTPGCVHAVDHWRGSIEHQAGLADKDPGWLYQQFHHNLLKHIDVGRVIPIAMDSISAAHFFRDFQHVFDMVFIDGSHEYEAVKADIEAWTPIVKGMLCGHDAGHPPVMRATHEAFPQVRHERSMWVVEL
jgi:predicted O-methyltransferase YrrM